MAYDPLNLQAGTLRHKVKFQDSSSNPDQFGETSTTWSTVLDTRASIDVVTQKELFQANVLTSQFTHSVKIRYPGASIVIRPGMRVWFGSHVYLVQSVENVQQRNRILKCMVLALNDAE